MVQSKYTYNNNFTGNMGSAKSLNGPYMANTNGNKSAVLLLRPKVMSIFINNEIISFSALSDIFGFTNIYKVELFKFSIKSCDTFLEF